MRIAFVSYEYAGGANGGGIGTYVRNASAMLATRGHRVEVFTSGSTLESREIAKGIGLYTVPGDRARFAENICPVFACRQQSELFDVVEGAEYGADASEVSRAFPDLPLVVKLHGPSFTIQASNDSYVGLRARGRYYLGALRRGRWPDNPWHYDPRQDRERTHALAADAIVANSGATAERVGQVWGLPRERVSVVPLAFVAPRPLLRIDPQSGSKRVLFVGRLEVRKGVLELANAVPLVARHSSDVRFRFVGRDLPHPADRAPISHHILRTVGAHADAVEIVGGVPYDVLAKEFENADICVFPSDWEASGYVCLEAMAAARGVIGSSAGGMAEIIEHGRTGLLVPPRNPRAIADAILTLLRDPERRIAMGRAAREYVTTAYSPDAIGPLQEASYMRAIERAKARCAA
jgi:glycosyltransferase involved in cell wall biosynthesis